MRIMGLTMFWRTYAHAGSLTINPSRRWIKEECTGWLFLITAERIFGACNCCKCFIQSSCQLFTFAFCDTHTWICCSLKVFHYNKKSQIGKIRLLFNSRLSYQNEKFIFTRSWNELTHEGSVKRIWAQVSPGSVFTLSLFIRRLL